MVCYSEGQIKYGTGEPCCPGLEAVWDETIHPRSGGEYVCKALIEPPTEPPIEPPIIEPPTVDPPDGEIPEPTQLGTYLLIFIVIILGYTLLKK